ncbi:MAG: NAD(P)H-hydrate dehydratase [Deltaproteobacteria bacterium]|jgi:NAD(P)H-hydrate epimerase|nr:NAD(P)H-hydrate dehydratase [Deltaproteobacteria bacterium]
MFVTDTRESRKLDQLAMASGLAGVVLMENASRSIFKAALEFWPQLGQDLALPVVILAGSGQNGGDGLVLARLFDALGHPTVVYQVGHEPNGDAAINYQILVNLGLPPLTIRQSSDPLPVIPKEALLVDALFGTGLTKPITGVALPVLKAASDHPGPVLAVDLPSGLSGDTGDALGPVIKAHLTVTVGAYKRGLFLKDGPDLSGLVKVADLGLSPRMLAKAAPKGRYLDDNLARTFLPPRPESGHKGTFGHAVLTGGGVGRTGALALATLGALRSGCGLVTAAAPGSLASNATRDLHSAMTLALPEDEPGTFAAAGEAPLLNFLALKKKALGLGPGMGLNPGSRALIQSLAENVPQPVVLDADALTALAGNLEILAKAKGPRVITPHPGEGAALLGLSSKDIQNDRFGSLLALGQKSQSVVLLKGKHTLILEPKTGQYLVNSTGGPILAVGGTGDILTGLIAGFLAQGLPPLAAAGLAAFAHGRAADLLAAKAGSRGIFPMEVVALLPLVIKGLSENLDFSKNVIEF